MALFNTTSAIDTDECFESTFDMITASYEMMSEIMEESYRLNSALYLTDAMLESKRAEGVSEASLEVLLEEAKKGFGQKIKDFFKMIWKRITDFFTKIKKYIKAIFNKKYRLELKRELYQAKIDKYTKKLANVEKILNATKDIAQKNKQIAGLLPQAVGDALKSIDNGATADEAKEVFAKKLTDGKASNPSDVKDVILLPAKAESNNSTKDLPVSTNESESKENASVAEKTMEYIEATATEVATTQEKVANDIVKQGESAAKKHEDDPAKSAAVQSVIVTAVNMNQVLTQGVQSVLNDNAKKTVIAVSGTKHMSIDDTNKKVDEENKPTGEKKILLASVISWDPFLEAYVIEGDDTPDLDDLDDDLDDTDEACGKKSLKEGATLLDQALGML